MLHRIRVIAIALATVAYGCALFAAEPSLTYVDLVRRLTGLEALAALPLPGETNAMWASNDRRAQVDGATGKYLHWDANGDGTGCIRMEGKQMVMAEMEGPGVIWRIWSAKADKGHVKITLDGQPQPAVDLPFDHYFDAKHAPFAYPSLGYESARGRNLYFPIPYQKSCKVVADPGWGRYYQFTYTTYPKGTRLPTFTADLPPEAVSALKEADQFLQTRLGTDPSPRRKGQQTQHKTAAVGPGQTAVVARYTQPGAITGIRARLDLKDRADQMAALRHLVLRITWDGAATPAVWCPLGDFFGTAPGVNLYKSLPAGMTEHGFYALWYMPFGKSALVELVNDGPAAREVQFEITHAPLTRPFAELSHFHCKWHRDVFPLPKDRWPDWTLLRTQGRGRFVGVMLHVWNPRGGQCPDAGEGRWWWGEGDEKFFVDGEKFPSTFGTGTEDYFGYAWCTPALFHRPFHNQTMTEGNRGHQSVNRWQVADNVPFQKSFEGCLEKYFPNSYPTLYAATVAWYLAPGGVDPHEPVHVSERHGYYDRPPLKYGDYVIVGEPPGQVATQNMKNFKLGKWTNDDHLWWTRGKPGDKLTLAFPIQKAGEQEVKVILTKARDYAIVQLHIDGKKAGEPIDLYNPEVIRTEPLSLGIHNLSAGKHQLTVEITGANKKADKAYMFGLDQVLVAPPSPAAKETTK